ncbi:MAG: hypothetical protein ABSB60_14690 [Terracidiphilus sp.]
MKLRNHEWLRFGRLAGLLRIVVCLMGMVRGVAAPAQAISTTTVQGTVYLANGEPGAGTLVVSWPSFTTASGQVVVAGQTAVTIAPDGFLSVNLTPNLGATPAGLYYTAVYYLSDGTTTTQYWVVPAAPQVTLAQIQSQLMPPAQAVQAVSKAYVDQAIQSLASGVLSVSSATMTGALTLCCDPTQPLQAADKHYVDENIALAVPISGGTMTGPLTSTKIGGLYQVDQFPGADFGAQLSACLSGLSPTSGGTCDARNFSGTLSMGSNLTISTANATVLLPCATISTANQLIVTAGTRNVSLRGCSLRGASTASGSQGGTVFLYSGGGATVQVGDPTYGVDTMGFHLDNVVINTTGSTSATTQGLLAYRTQELDLESLYFLGNSNQTGMTLDGTGNYTGGTFLDNALNGFQSAVNAVGHQVANSATTDWMNASAFVRLHIDCPTNNGSPASGTYGINLQQGDGNTFIGGDVEGCATALHLGANAQNNTIDGLRNENSTFQVVADAGSAYNSWVTGGTMFTGQLSDNGTRNSFLDTFHRSFNGLNGDWYGSQSDATVTNHFRIGTGTGNERGLLDRYQTDYGYRWTIGLSDATAGEQFYQILDELNHVYRISVGQYNNGQSSTNNQTVINSAGTGAVVLNGSNNSGTGGVVIGSGGPSETTVATINNAGNAQFNGTMQVGGVTTFASTPTVKNQADAEIDAVLWAGLTTSQKESFSYKDWNGNSQWYMVKDASNNWALNSATGALDSFKAYQSTNTGDTYIDAINSTGVVRVNYEPGSGSAFSIYGGGTTSPLYASFTGITSIKFPGLAASSGHFCLQIDTSGYISNTGAACGTGSANGTVTQVTLSMPADFNVNTANQGTTPAFSVSRNSQNANYFLAGPCSGSPISPAYRALCATDLPPATASAQGAVQLPAGASGNTLGTAAMQPASAFDAAGAAASAVAGSMPGNAATATNFQTQITGPVNGNGVSSPSAASAHNLAGPVNCVTTGSANTYSCATSPSFTIATGDHLQVEFNVGNTGSSTLSVNGGTAYTIKKSGGTATMASGDIQANHWIGATFDGTYIQLEGQLGNVNASQVNGASVPASAGILGSNASSQLVAATGVTTTTNSAFGGSANAFANNAAGTENDLLLEGGASGSQGVAALEYATPTGTAEWKLKMDTSEYLRLNDAVNNLDREVFYQNGNTYINAGNGSNGVCINCTNNSGTAGILIYNGASTSAQVAQINGSGSASFNGPTVTVGVSGSQTGTVKLSSNTSGGSVAITPASASSAYTATLPAANDTLVELAQTQTLTNKSIALSEVNSGYNAGGIVGATSTTAACSSTYTANAVVKMASSSSTCPGASSLIDTGTNVYTTEPSYYANGNQLLGTAATSITSTALASASIAFPATSGQFAAQYTGFCHIVWQQSTAAATVQFGINASSAPTHMSLSSISYPGTTAVPYGTGVTDITTASAVAATGSITPGAAGTNYITEITVNLSAPATANTLTLYALTSNASDALLIEPGTVCRWY